MKRFHSDTSVIALVCICLAAGLTIFGFAYDLVTNQERSRAEWVMDSCACSLCLFGCGFSLKHMCIKKTAFKSKTTVLSETQTTGQNLDKLRYTVAMEQLNCIIFDYHIQDNAVLFKSGSLANTEAFSDFLLKRKYSPEYLPEKGIVHPDGVREYLRVFREIREGKPSAACTLQIKGGNGQYCWCKLMLTGAFDKDTRMDCAFGIIEDITEQKETEKRFLKEQKYKEAILSSAIVTYKVNFTKNRFLRGQDNWMELFGIIPTDNYSDMLETMAQHGIFSDDRKMFFDTFSMKSVMASFDTGNTEITLDYRRSYLNQKVMWVQCSLHLLRDPFTQDVKGIAYIKDIDEQKVREMDIRFRAEHDSLCGIYNRDTVKRMVTEFLQTEQGKINQHALMIIDIDDFKSINDNHGHMQGDTVLKLVAESMKIIFRSTDIVGRLAGDEFILFLKNISRPEAAVRKAKELNHAIEQLHLESSPACRLSASIGIAQCPGNGTTFDELYRNADTALYQAKKSGKNHFVMFSLCPVQSPFNNQPVLVKKE